VWIGCKADNRAQEKDEFTGVAPLFYGQFFTGSFLRAVFVTCCFCYVLFGLLTLVF